MCPEARSYGQSWIYLDTEQKYEQWIVHYEAPSPPKNSRKIPAGMRFDDLHRVLLVSIVEDRNRK